MYFKFPYTVHYPVVIVKKSEKQLLHFTCVIWFLHQLTNFFVIGAH